MSGKGFILLHRSIQNHWIYEEKRKFSRYEAWLDLLMLVNHKDNRILQDGELIEVKRGERITSIRHLMNRWDWSNTKVENFLKLLQQDEMILFETTERKKTWIKILQYEKYQGFEKEGQSAEKAAETQSYQVFDENEQSVKQTVDFSKTKINSQKTITEKTEETQSHQGLNVSTVSENRQGNDNEQTQKRINNNDNNDNKNNRRQYTDDEPPMKLANFLLNEIRKNNPNHKQPNLQTWANTMRLLLEKDNRDKSEVSKVIKWVQSNSFWYANILSPEKLRKQYDTLKMQMNQEEQTIHKPAARESYEPIEGRTIKPYNGPYLD